MVLSPYLASEPGRSLVMAQPSVYLWATIPCVAKVPSKMSLTL